MTAEPLHVLVVDDDRNSASILCEHVQNMGLPIYCRMLDALPNAECETEPQIVVLDPELWNMEPKSLIRRVRQRFPFARVIAFTRGVRLPREAVAPMLEAGVDAIVSKEHRLPPLLTVFARVLVGGKWVDPLFSPRDLVMAGAI